MTKPVTMRARGRTLAFLLIAATAALACNGDRAGGQRGGAMRLGNDIVVSGNQISIAETVPGDAIVAGGDIDYTGSAGGDYLGAGGAQRIAGSIGGSVRAAGGEIRLSAPVGRNATLAGGQVTVEPASRIAGNAYIAAGQVRVAGTVGGVLVVNGADVVIDGVIEGDARVRAATLRLGPNAHVVGNLYARTTGANIITDTGARVDGEVVAEPAPRPGGALRLLRILLAIGFLAAGTVAVAILPRRIDSAAALIRRRPLVTAGLGVAALVVVPIVILTVAITVIGIPLAVIAAALYLIVVYLARAVVAVWIGRLILGSRAGHDRKGAVVAFLLGALFVLAAQALPWIGGLAALVATIIGLGATVLLISGRAGDTEETASA